MVTLLKTDTGKCECDLTRAYIDEEGNCKLKECQCEDGLSTIGDECPVHNQTLCKYSGTFESAHPYNTENLALSANDRKWSVEVPFGRFFKMEIDSFKTYSDYEFFMIRNKGKTYQFTGDDDNVNDRTFKATINSNVDVENDALENPTSNRTLYSYYNENIDTDSKGFNLCTNTTVDFEFWVRERNWNSFYGYKINWEIVDSCECSEGEFLENGHTCKIKECFCTVRSLVLVPSIILESLFRSWPIEIHPPSMLL